jgi:hypothetical protein
MSGIWPNQRAPSTIGPGGSITMPPLTINAQGAIFDNERTVDMFAQKVRAAMDRQYGSR